MDINGMKLIVDKHINLMLDTIDSSLTPNLCVHLQHGLWRYSDTSVISQVQHMQYQDPWASYQIRKIAGCACAGNARNVFPCRRFQRKPLVSDPGMHHGTCVTHVPWCMSGSLTCGDRENVPGIPGACAPAILRIWQEAHCHLTHLPLDKIAAVSQMIFSDTFSWMEMYELRLKFHWRLFLSVLLTISQNLFR